MVSKTCSSMTTSEFFFYGLFILFFPPCLYLVFDLLAIVKYVVLNVKYALSSALINI